MGDNKNKYMKGIILQLYKDDITLSVWVNDKFKSTGDVFGHIEIGGSLDSDKNCFWDNISFFQYCGRKEFNRECKQELKEKNFDHRQTYKDIKSLIKKAYKLGILKQVEDINYEY